MSRDLFHDFFYQSDRDKKFGRRAGNLGFSQRYFYSYSTVIGALIHAPGQCKDEKPRIFLYSRNSMSPTTQRHISQLRDACPFHEGEMLEVPFEYGDRFYGEDMGRVMAERFDEELERRATGTFSQAGDRRYFKSLISDARKFSTYVRTMEFSEAVLNAEKEVDRITELRRIAAKNRRAALEDPNSDLYKAREEKERKLRGTFKKAVEALIALHKGNEHEAYLELILYLKNPFDRSSERKEFFKGLCGGADKAEKAFRRWCENAIDRTYRYSYVWLVGDIVHTSRGIDMPVAVVKRLMERNLRKEVSVGMHVEKYEIQEMAEDYVKIGCHRIPWDNINAMQAVLGLPSEPMSCLELLGLDDKQESEEVFQNAE